MAVGCGYRKMMARIPVHPDRRLIPDIAPRVALPRNQYIDAESIHAVLQAGPPELGSLAAAAICSFAAFHSAIAHPVNISTINARRITFPGNVAWSYPLVLVLYLILHRFIAFS
jgi:hypothetical protein